MKPLTLRTPKVPAFIEVETYDRRSRVVTGNPPLVHIAYLSDAQLRDVGQRWTTQLLLNAQGFRAERARKERG